jgi:uroporphyrinogen III methyltransferase/synthase
MTHGKKVYITGAGCGDKELITLKAVNALRECDVVIYDSLINDELLELAPKDSEKIFAGKKMGCHYMPQEEINSLIIKKANENKTVVRLKGGDPFVFGRGGEEIEVLKKADIPYAVIPGITSAIAAAEYVGIPVTHRNLSRGFHVITGHTAQGRAVLSESFDTLARLEGTLIFLMGLSNIDEIVQGLIENGKDPLTPSAVISNGTLPNEKCIKAPLKDIAKKAKEENMPSPAVIIIGGVTELNMKNTFVPPLKGKKCALTGSRQFVNKLSPIMENMGAETIKIPHAQIKPLVSQEEFEKIIAEISRFTWLAFTSANGIDIFFDMLLNSKFDIRSLGNIKFACIGSGTANALKKYGIKADFVPSKFTAEAMGKELNDILTEKDAVLAPRAANASPLFEENIKKAAFKAVKLYEIEINKAIIEKNAEKAFWADFIVFGSRCGAEGWLEYAAISPNTVPVCIGKPTSQALEEKRIKNYIIPPKAQAEYIAETILNEVKNR